MARTVASRSACSGLWQITNRCARMPLSPPVAGSLGLTWTSLRRRLPATVRYRPARASAARASVLVCRSFSAWM